MHHYRCGLQLCYPTISITGYPGDREFSINHACGNLGTRLYEIGAGPLVCDRSRCLSIKQGGRFKSALILAMPFSRLRKEVDLLEDEAMPYFMSVATLELSLLLHFITSKECRAFQMVPFHTTRGSLRTRGVREPLKSCCM